MGQKVNPIGLRTALTKNWESRWFAGKQSFGDWLHEDIMIRRYIKDNFSSAAISRIQIERFASRVRITIFSARPGLLIGKKGGELDKLRQTLSEMTSGKEFIVDIAEIKRAEINAVLVAENICAQLERRIGFRRAMKRAIQVAMDMGVDGIKINCAGRLGGAELAREEQYKDGRVPLHTLRANIDYGFAEANTTAGKIGVKVWICHNEPTEDQKYAIDAKKGKAQKGSARK
ncbi:MAG: 30S ribosomal protein S3 [Victivallaceae bacterium]|nr:30S ribosomal protein S3 [Victivallaceae bacterium]